MKRITDVTRQDIIDIIQTGIWIPFDEVQYNGETGEYEDGYNLRIPIYGRLNEIDFLARIYPLDSLPSTDRRFSNARSDIWQHTVMNDDWDRYWYFSDSRFKLSNGNDDEYILRFICEMLHPAVRNEKSQWREYLKKFNEILEPDGYRLVSTRNVSGREVFEAQEIDHVEINRSNEMTYTGIQLIGEGSYAKVFKYTDEFYAKDFVLKRALSDLNEKEIKRFKREYEQMSIMKSPYVVEVYSYNNDKHEYTMELMDCTLDEYMKYNNPSMTMQKRKSIITQLIRGFKYIHTKGVYHRDISFKNILLKQYDDVMIVKISDFGLVKIADSDLTSENTEFKGSLNDPALKVEGFANYGLLHEIYAITLLFTYVLTGKKNWDKITDPYVKTFISKGTDPDKTKRFQSLDELSEGVLKCISEMEKNNS